VARGELSNEIVEADGNFPKRSPLAEIVVFGNYISVENLIWLSNCRCQSMHRCSEPLHMIVIIRN
jgi:hypothetical protein